LRNIGMKTAKKFAMDRMNKGQRKNKKSIHIILEMKGRRRKKNVRKFKPKARKKSKINQLQTVCS
jgi:hypothetical protein